MRRCSCSWELRAPNSSHRGFHLSARASQRQLRNWERQRMLVGAFSALRAPSVAPESFNLCAPVDRSRFAKTPSASSVRHQTGRRIVRLIRQELGKTRCETACRRACRASTIGCPEGDGSCTECRVDEGSPRAPLRPMNERKSWPALDEIRARTKYAKYAQPYPRSPLPCFYGNAVV
jgi:hypothetical protein